MDKKRRDIQKIRKDDDNQNISTATELIGYA